MRTGGRKEKTEEDISIFSREMRGWCSSMAWTSREEGFYRKEDGNGLEVAMGNKDDAEPIYRPERHEMYEKELTLFRGLWVGWG